jgi:flagellar basal body-associated protein FliL
MQNDNQPNPNQQPQNNQGAPTGPPQGQPPQQVMATPPPQGQPQQPVQPNQNAYSPAPNNPRKKSSKGVTIALILVILLIFGGLFYSFLQSQDEAQEPVPAETQELAQEPVEDENIDEDVQLDAQRSLAAVGAFQVNNEGRLPDLNNEEDLNRLNEELLDTFTSPLTNAPYEFIIEEPQQGQLQIETNILCSGGVSEGEFLVRTALSDSSIYCTDSLN